MQNKIEIEGIVQKGYADRPAVRVKRLDSGREVATFSIISKYGPEEKFSSGIVKVEKWADSPEASLDEQIFPGDRVIVVGELKTNSWEDKAGIRKYELMVTAFNVRKVDLSKVEYDSDTDKKQPEKKKKARQESKLPELQESEMPVPDPLPEIEGKNVDDFQWPPDEANDESSDCERSEEEQEGIPF